MGVGLSTTDGAQHLAGGRLLGEGVGQLGIPCLQFLEQSNILDRDNGLVGEGLQKCDLVVGKPAGFAARHSDRSNRLGLTKQWHHDPASELTGMRERTSRFGQPGIGLGVGDVERRSLANDLGMRFRGLE